MSDHLFVYGTLRAGARHEMHAALAEHAERVGPARARGRLVDLGWYPGLVETEAECFVVGELWFLRDASVLQRLDVYEGNEYERCIRPIEVASGRTFDAWIYLYRGSDPGRPLESGDWLRR